MNTQALARIALICIAGLAAATGAEAKGSLSVGLTIVSSCKVSSDSAYRAASSVAGANTALVAGCSNDTNYTVSLSPAPKAEAATRYEVARTGADVVVTLTY